MEPSSPSSNMRLLQKKVGKINNPATCPIAECEERLSTQIVLLDQVLQNEFVVAETVFEEMLAWTPKAGPVSHSVPDFGRALFGHLQAIDKSSAEPISPACGERNCTLE